MKMNVDEDADADANANIDVDVDVDASMQCAYSAKFSFAVYSKYHKCIREHLQQKCFL